MKSRWRRSAAVLAAGLVLLAGCGGAQQAASTAQGQQPPVAQGNPFSGTTLTTLASSLGVSKSKLQTALKASQPSGGQPPSGGSRPPSGSGGGPGNLAATLAKQLDLSEAKVQAALDKVMPQRGQTS
jgi:hypothetical protein